MSGQKNSKSGNGKTKVGRKSGILTGLVLVSTGLIAGYQGLELTMPQAMSQQQGERSARAINEQISDLDEMVTATLGREEEQRQRRQMVDLIKSTKQKIPAEAVHAVVAAPAVADPVSLVEARQDKTLNPAPLVNRVAKADRGVMPAETAKIIAENNVAPAAVKAAKLWSRRDDALAAVEEPVSDSQFDFDDAPENGTEPVQPEADAGMDIENAAAKQVRNIASALHKSEIPLADSADVALFAADMPLPAKLTRTLAMGAKIAPAAAPIIGGNSLAGFGRSPMQPRLYASGKAFGGLAEREFQKRERRCMTTALYFEARSESEAGQVAVGQVIMNRVKSPDYPDTICGVVYQGSHRRTGCQFSFTCDGKADKPNSKKMWERSKRLANRLLEGKAYLASVGLATHYHATYVSPRWRHKMARLTKIGRHIFYKSPNISVTATYQRYSNGKRG